MKRIKLNNKGFTLIELLAVIVILAIILVIAVPEVLEAMSSSRTSAIHSSAKTVANWYSEVSVADSLAAEASKVIPSDMYNSADTTGTKIKKDTWLCMDKVTGTKNSTSYNLLDLAGVSSSDVVISTDTNASAPSGTCDTTITPTATTCAAICIPSVGVPKVVLVAKAGGKFYNNGSLTYGVSTEDNGVSK